MDDQKYTLASLRQELTDNNLHVKAIIQDILAFRGSIVELEDLNEAGRAKLSALRKHIGRLNEWASDEGDAALNAEVETHRQQFSRTLQAFRKANISTMLEIEKLEKEELFNNDDVGGGGGDTSDSAAAGDQAGGDAGNDNNTSGGSSSSPNTLRQRSTTTTTQQSSNRHSRSSLVAQQDSVTDRMLAISRHLSETTQRSAATLDTLVASSAHVEGARDELHATAGTIQQSGKLLKKYGRRECTDKVLLMFAFAFFLACVVYIVQKRVF